MRVKSPLWYIFCVGSLLISLGIVGGDSFNRFMKEENGMAGFKKTFIRVKDVHIPDENVFFTTQNLKDLNKRDITLAASSFTELDSYRVRVIGTNSEYPDFVKLSYDQGCFFNKSGEHDRVVVIDEKLAWDKFKTLNVTGNNLKIFNKRFRVVGVIAPDKSIIGLLSQSAVPNAYIPIGSLQDLDKNARITSLQIINQDSEFSGQNLTDAENLLKQIGKTPDDYYIIDFNVENVLLDQKPRILVLIIGLISILFLLRSLIQRVKEVHTFIRTECQSQYIDEVLGRHKAILLRKLIFILFILVVITFIWISIKFDIYTPPENLPKELTDLPFYYDLFKQGISDSINVRGYLPTPLELRINSIRMLAGWLFYLALLAGFPLVWLSLRFRRRESGDQSFTRTIFTLSWSFAAAVSLSVIIVWLVGLSPSLSAIKLGIVFSFIYIYTFMSFDQGNLLMNRSEAALPSQDMSDRFLDQFMSVEERRL